MKKRHDLKTLLVQIRKDNVALKEEHTSFATFAELQLDQVDILNVYKTPAFEPAILNSYDALFVGGSRGEGTILLDEEKPGFVLNLFKLFDYAKEKSLPTLASCFGFEAAVVAFGGELYEDKPSFELGSVKTFVTEEGKKDILLHDTPDAFYAITGHQKFIKKQPKGITVLARSEQCGNHMFKIKERPLYFTQFHPELALKTLVERLTVYRTTYFSSHKEFEEGLKKFHCETSEANALISKFIDRVVLPA